ncbi:MAG: cob(I)yrinic acid a,c-diamide adenosyltransferase [Bacteroidetes bacterium]|nr:cob(I)yrinic acid a,c-diamide adenosyltransferase [Bacteroidota bacterium]
MKIYTKKGDRGMTSLIGGSRVSKANLRIDAYGTVDELNACIGVTQSCMSEEDLEYQLITEVQNDLFIMGSLLAADPVKNSMELPTLENADVLILEHAIDRMNEELPELRSFILPSGNVHVAQCHVTRCVCRRAERSVVRLSEDDIVPEIILEYLNRLSDYLFVLARKIGKDFGVAEVEWKPRA